MRDKTLILERLVASGLVTKEQLKKAQEQARLGHIDVEEVLIKQEIITEEDLSRIIADESGQPFMDLKDYLIDTQTIKIVPETIAKKYSLLPLFKIGRTLTIAMSDPRDLEAIDEVRTKTGLDVEPVVACAGTIEKMIEQYYGVSGTIEEILEKMGEKKAAAEETEEMTLKTLEEAASETPVVKFVNLLVMEAIKGRASDIHIEPEEDTLRVRYRIDGILHEKSSPPKHMQAPIISRIKILSKLDIAEKRKPQDGRFQMRMENRDIDIRVSTFPTLYGENLVMRLLDCSRLLLSLVQLGFSEDVLKKFERLIQHPNGIILVTGPTGSGKTTSLYAALSTINSEDKNIITIEDPVEYHLPLIRQSQVNPKAGISFANGLRSILRQDPDVIMVGEIRDLETAEIAVQAALTGHLVFSTLHTNDAPSAITRLLDMGVEPFLVASSVIAVLAQRLVRIICPSCKEQYTSDRAIKEIAELNIFKGMLFYRGKGCEECNKTGFLGRIAIFEFMVVNEEIRKLIVAKASSDDIKKAAVRAGMQTLREGGFMKVESGITTPEEVLRVTAE